MKTIILNTNKNHIEKDLKQSGIPSLSKPNFSLVKIFENKAYFRGFLSYENRLYSVTLCINITFNTKLSSDMKFSELLDNISNETQKSSLNYFSNTDTDNYIRKYEEICKIQEIDISFCNNIINIEII